MMLGLMITPTTMLVMMATVFMMSMVPMPMTMMMPMVYMMMLLLPMVSGCRVDVLTLSHCQFIISHLLEGVLLLSSLLCL